MLLLALSPVPDFLLWSLFSYYNPTFLLSSDSVFSTKNAPKLQKQFRSMTPYTPSTTRPSFPCPNPMCGKIFNTSDLVCQHLAIPDSYCSRWAMDIINRMHRSSDVDNGKGFFSHRLR